MPSKMIDRVKLSRRPVQRCPWSHAVNGKCLENVTTFRRGDEPKCGHCGWFLTTSQATHDERGRLIDRSALKGGE